MYKKLLMLCKRYKRLTVFAFLCLLYHNLVIDSLCNISQLSEQFL